MSELLGSIARSPVKLLRMVYSIRDRRSRRHPEPPTRTSASSTSADERAALNGQRTDPAAAQHVRTDNLLEFCVDLRLQRRARPVSSSGRGIPARADDGDLLVEDVVHLSPPFQSCYGRLQQSYYRTLLTCGGVHTRECAKACSAMERPSKLSQGFQISRNESSLGYHLVRSHAMNTYSPPQ